MFTFKELSGQLECASVTLTSDHPARYPIDGTVLRHLQVASLMREALLELEVDAGIFQSPQGVPLNLADMDDIAKAAMAEHDERLRQYGESLAAVVKATSDARGRRYPAGHLAEVARLYKAACRRRSPKPTHDTAKALGITRAAAAKQVARARAEGLLPKTTQGKAAAVKAARRRTQP